MKKKLEDLQQVIDIQTSDGNWNWSEYMLGMANGLLIADAIMNDKEPVFLKAPEKWGIDKAGDELAKKKIIL